ncbi:MAG: metal-dependent transcriptional regulator [Spirochaetales bacterium]|nr:metal-dependent transcriptional regulator [Spirochaetales bacterium]
MGKNKKKLSNSLEDYLEAIIYLERTQRVARVRDIAKLLKVQMPSVSGAMSSLKEKGYINYERNSYITLTELGMSAANCLSSKHDVIGRFLVKVLGLPEERGMEVAGNMLHSVDCETNRRLSRFMEYFEDKCRDNEPLCVSEWLDYIQELVDVVPFTCSEWCDTNYQKAEAE